MSKVLVHGAICQGTSLQSKGVSGMRREDDSGTIYALVFFADLKRSLPSQAGNVPRQHACGGEIQGMLFMGQIMWRWMALVGWWLCGLIAFILWYKDEREAKRGSSK